MKGLLRLLTALIRTTRTPDTPPKQRVRLVDFAFRSGLVSLVHFIPHATGEQRSAHGFSRSAVLRRLARSWIPRMVWCGGWSGQGAGLTYCFCKSVAHLRCSWSCTRNTGPFLTASPTAGHKARGAGSCCKHRIVFTGRYLRMSVSSDKLHSPTCSWPDPWQLKQRRVAGRIFQ